MYARTPDQGVARLNEGGWDYIYLDHDLGLDPSTGRDLRVWPCVDYVCEHAEKFFDTHFVIVTSNPYGRDQMRRQLSAFNLVPTVMVDTGATFSTLDVQE